MKPSFNDTIVLLVGQMFSYNWLIIVWKGRVRLKLDVQCQADRRISNVDGQGMGGLENWTVFMDVVCVSSLTWNYLLKVYLKVLCCWERNLAELWDLSKFLSLLNDQDLFLFSYRNMLILIAFDWLVFESEQLWLVSLTLT